MGCNCASVDATPQCCRDCIHADYDDDYYRAAIYCCMKGRFIPTRKQSCSLQELTYAAKQRIEATITEPSTTSEVYTNDPS